MNWSIATIFSSQGRLPKFTTRAFLKKSGKMGHFFNLVILPQILFSAQPNPNMSWNISKMKENNEKLWIFYSSWCILSLLIKMNFRWFAYLSLGDNLKNRKTLQKLESCFFDSPSRDLSFDVWIGPGEARLFEIKPFYFQCILHSNAENQEEEENAMLILWEAD